MRPVPAQADDIPPPADRAKVVSAWRNGGVQVRAAAAEVLVGSDADVSTLLGGGRQQAESQDERDAAGAVTGAVAWAGRRYGH